MSCNSKSALIIGVGLIGGSIGLNLKKYNLFYKVIGFGRNKINLQSANEIGAIDDYYTDLNDIDWKNISLIFLCTPINQIVDYAIKISSFLSDDSVITDVGSTKSRIVSEINSFYSSNNIKAEFIGSHPIAGKEKSGVENSSDILFQNAYCIITPDNNSNIKKINYLKNIWHKFGSQVIVMSPDKHDLITAVISHLPHIVASSLVNTAGEIQVQEQDILNYAAGGFKDITRIASSDEKLWVQIMLSNKEKILSVLKKYNCIIKCFEDILEKEADSEIEKYFLNAKELRNSIRLQGTGLLLNYYDLEVAVEDRPGIIAGITKTLSDNKINIKDIEILKYREYEDGILKLSFESEDNLNTAYEILQSRDYEVKKR